MNTKNETEILIPDGWTLAKHKDIATINPKFKTPPISENKFVSFIPMSLVEAETGKVNLSEKRLYRDVKKGYTPFVNDDLIFAKITPCMENGKIAILKNLHNEIGFGSTEFHVSRISELINRKYVYFYFVQKKVKIDARKNMTGSAGQLRVPKPYFENISIAIPPLPEQHRIVAKIEELFSELDQGIKSLKTAQQQLKIYRQAVLKWAFEGKLTAEWREQQQKEGKLESVEILLENIKLEREKRYQQQLEEWKGKVKVWEENGKEGRKLSKPRKPKTIQTFNEQERSELSSIPNFWRWCKVGQFSLNVEYGTSAKSKKEGKIPVLRMGNIQNNIFDWSDLVYTSDEKEINQYLLRKGDVLFNRTNSPELVGKTAIYQGERPAIFAGYLIRVNHFQSYVNSKYLNYFLNSMIAKNYSNKVKTDGVNQSNINGEKLANYPFPYSSITEQDQIVQEIESRFSICDQLETTIKDNLKKSEALRQSILKRAFEGKLVPQDPNDEPAEKLLERIKKEKAGMKNQVKQLTLETC